MLLLFQIWSYCWRLLYREAWIGQILFLLIFITALLARAHTALVLWSRTGSPRSGAGAETEEVWLEAELGEVTALSQQSGSFLLECGGNFPSPCSKEVSRGCR